MNLPYNNKCLLVVVYFLSFFTLSAQDLPNTGVLFSLSNSQGFCAPFSLEMQIVVPENSPTTEYIFILHDILQPYTYSDTLSYFQADIPEFISFQLESSSCSASGAGYKIDYYIKDLSSPAPFNSDLGLPLNSLFPIFINGSPAADFSVNNNCNLFTFENNSISGELIDDGTCESEEEHIYWLIGADASEYEIISGVLGDDFFEGSETLDIQFFEPGHYQVSIVAATCAADTLTKNICVENVSPEIEFNIPDTVCVDELIVFESTFDEPFFCESTYTWGLAQLTSECSFSSSLYTFENNSDSSSFEPSLLIHNPGLYEIHFTATSSCEDFPIEYIDSIFIQGSPQIQDYTYSQACSSYQINLVVDYDTCLSSSSINYDWNVVAENELISEDLDLVELIFQSAGEYQIEYSLTSECGSDTAIFDVSVADTLIVDLGNDTIVCFGASLELIPEVSGGILPYSYEWIGLNASSPFFNIENIETSLELILQVSDLNCTELDTVFIDVPTAPELVLDSLYTMCEGDTLTISPEYLFDTELYTIIWQDTIESLNFVYSEEDSIEVHLLITDSIGCSYSEIAFIDVSFIPEFELDTLNYCADDEMIMPTPHLNGVWEGDYVVFDTITGDYLFNDNQASDTEHEIYYSIENEFGCNAQDTTVLIINSNPSLGIFYNPTSFCAPDISYLVLAPETFENPITTNYTINVFQGENSIVESFNHIQSNLPDTLFFNDLTSSSCDAVYSDTVFNGAYFVQIEAHNDSCDFTTIVTSKLFYSEAAHSDFQIDSTSACQDSIYTFTNESTGASNLLGDCSPSDIIWQISGEQGVHWNVISGQLGDSIAVGSDSLDIQFMNSGDYEITLIATSCNSDTLNKFICVEGSLNPIVSVPNSACTNTELDIENNTDASGICSIEYLWSVAQVGSFCLQGASSDFALTNSQSSIPNITINNPGEYLITCEMSNDCVTLTTTDTVLISSPPEVTLVDVNQLDICNSGHISLELETENCATPLFNYSWQVEDASIIQSDSLEMELILDNYGANQIMYTIVNLCGTDNFVYTYNYQTPLVVEFGPMLTFCNQSIPQLLDDPNTGSWSGLYVQELGGEYLFTPTQEGLFTVAYSYTDANNCAQQEFLDITVLPLVVVDITQNIASSVNVPVAFAYSPLGGAFSADESVSIVGNTVAGSTVGEYVVYYEYGYNTCYVIDSMTFVVGSLPVVSINDTIICYGDSVLLSPDIEFVSEPYSQVWNTANVNQNIYVSPDVTTSYSFLVTDAFGGQTTVNTLVEVQCSYVNFEEFEYVHISNEMEQFLPNNASYENVLFEGCTGLALTFYKPECSIGDIAIDYHLEGSASLVDDYSVSPISQSITILSDQDSVSIEFIVNEDYLEETPDSIIIIIDPIYYTPCYTSGPDTLLFIINDRPALGVSLSPNQSVHCSGDEVVLEAQGVGGVGGLMSPFSSLEPFSYFWSNIGTAETQTVNPLVTSEYCVEVVDVCGRNAEACVVVYVPLYLPLEVESEFKYTCEDVEIQICSYTSGGDGVYTYEWLNGETESCIEDYEGIYTVIVTDGCGVQASTQGQIFFDEVANPSFEYLTIPHENLGVEFNNYTENISNLTCVWNFGDNSQGVNVNHPNPIHIYPEVGDYIVTLTATSSLYGCVNENSILVSVTSNFNLYIPSAFSPNNDDLNDGFRPIINGHDFYELLIMDKWGKQIYRTIDNEEYWGGENEGKPCSQGVYTCKITYSKSNQLGRHVTYTSVALIR